MHVCCFPVGSTECIFGVWGHFLALLLRFKDLVLDHDDYPIALERVQTPTCMFAFENFLTKLPVWGLVAVRGAWWLISGYLRGRGFVFTGSLHSLLLLEANYAIMADKWETKAVPKPRVGAGDGGVVSESGEQAQTDGMLERNDGFCNRTCRAANYREEMKFHRLTMEFCRQTYAAFHVWIPSVRPGWADSTHGRLNSLILQTWNI